MYVDESVSEPEPTTAPVRDLGWSGPSAGVAIAGVIAEVATCYNEEGTPIAAIDRAGRLGVYGLYVVDGVRLNAIPKNEGEQG